MIHHPYHELIRARRAANLGLPFDPALCSALIADAAERSDADNEDDREQRQALSEAAALANFALASDALPALDNLDAAADALDSLIRDSARLDRRKLAGYVAEITAELDRARKAVDVAYGQTEAT